MVGNFEKTVQKKVGRAIADYCMLKDGDKILVAVSGGKDSLALLELLMERKAFVPIKYDIVAVYVDLGAKLTDEVILRKFLRKTGCRFYFVRRKIFQDSKTSKPTCFWCSWNRRKALFESARKHGCNKIALGHHKDDIIATIMMNLLFEGQISAMVPFQELFRGKISIIRPLAYLEEQEVERFVESRQIPAADLLCPYSKTTKRAFVKKFIDEVETMCPNVKTNIFKSLQRIKKDYLLYPEKKPRALEAIVKSKCHSRESGNPRRGVLDPRLKHSGMTKTCRRGRFHLTQPVKPAEGSFK